MKKVIFSVLGVLLSVSFFAQVAIGKTSVDGSGILDFGTENKGILLPIVTTLPSNPANGTILMDGRAGQLKVEVFENDVWKELTTTGSLSVQSNSGVDTTTAVILNTSDEVGGGVTFGDVDTNGKPVSGAEGALVLEATDKALILPKVENPHLNIKSPRAGVICYDTVSDSLAVFDGVVWHFWK